MVKTRRSANAAAANEAEPAPITPFPEAQPRTPDMDDMEAFMSEPQDQPLLAAAAAASDSADRATPSDDDVKMDDKAGRPEDVAMIEEDTIDVETVAATPASAVAAPASTSDGYVTPGTAADAALSIGSPQLSPAIVIFDNERQRREGDRFAAFIKNQSPGLQMSALDNKITLSSKATPEIVTMPARLAIIEIGLLATELKDAQVEVSDHAAHVAELKARVAHLEKHAPLIQDARHRSKLDEDVRSGKELIASLSQRIEEQDKALREAGDKLQADHHLKDEVAALEYQLEKVRAQIKQKSSWYADQATENAKLRDQIRAGQRRQIETQRALDKARSQLDKRPADFPKLAPSHKELERTVEMLRGMCDVYHVATTEAEALREANIDALCRAVARTQDEPSTRATRRLTEAVNDVITRNIDTVFHIPDINASPSSSARRGANSSAEVGSSSAADTAKYAESASESASEGESDEPHQWVRVPRPDPPRMWAAIPHRMRRAQEQRAESLRELAANPPPSRFSAPEPTPVKDEPMLQAPPDQGPSRQQPPTRGYEPPFHLQPRTPRTFEDFRLAGGTGENNSTLVAPAVTAQPVSSATGSSAVHPSRQAEPLPLAVPNGLPLPTTSQTIAAATMPAPAAAPLAQPTTMLEPGSAVTTPSTFATPGDPNRPAIDPLRMKVFAAGMRTAVENLTVKRHGDALFHVCKNAFDTTVALYGMTDTEAKLLMPMCFKDDAALQLGEIRDEQPHASTAEMWDLLAARICNVAQQISRRNEFYNAPMGNSSPAAFAARLRKAAGALKPRPSQDVMSQIYVQGLPPTLRNHALLIQSKPLDEIVATLEQLISADPSMHPGAGTSRARYATYKPRVQRQREDIFQVTDEDEEVAYADDQEWPIVTKQGTGDVGSPIGPNDDTLPYGFSQFKRCHNCHLVGHISRRAGVVCERKPASKQGKRQQKN